MLVTSSGQVYGYLSGGCVEAAVAHEAAACLRDGQPRVLDYGVGSETVDIQLPCGGRINILVRSVTEPSTWIAALQQVKRLRRSVAFESDLATGLMRRTSLDATCMPGKFIKCYMPQTRLVLVGSDPVTLATAMLAVPLGMEVVLWRPNGPSSPPEGIRISRYLSMDLERGLLKLPLDPYTAIYCLSHDMEVDVPVLQRSLASRAFCVGVLGSRRKRAARIERLKAAGATEAECAHLRAPAGLSLGAETPQEIALSILAEILAVRSLNQARRASTLEMGIVT